MEAMEEQPPIKGPQSLFAGGSKTTGGHKYATNDLRFPQLTHPNWGKIKGLPTVKVETRFRDLAALYTPVSSG